MNRERWAFSVNVTTNKCLHWVNFIQAQPPSILSVLFFLPSICKKNIFVTKSEKRISKSTSKRSLPLNTSCCILTHTLKNK